MVLCHSLACLLWLHHAAAGGKPASRVLLAAPPSRDGRAGRSLAAFFPPPLDADRLARSAPDGARIVCADDDPYCPEGAVDLYAAPARRAGRTCCPAADT